MSVLNIWLIRHAQSMMNAGVITNNPLESVLTETGAAQAIMIADEVMNQPDLIVTSPANRAIETANPIRERWCESPCEVWPIQEWVYLSPDFYLSATPELRKAAVVDYWEKLEIEYCHGKGAESFAAFIARVAAFHAQLKQLQGYVVVVGHGMFFRAYQTCLALGFEPSPSLMKSFRMVETHNPMKNGEIIKYTRDDLMI